MNLMIYDNNLRQPFLLKVFLTILYAIENDVIIGSKRKKHIHAQKYLMNLGYHYNNDIIVRLTIVFLQIIWLSITLMLGYCFYKINMYMMNCFFK